MTAPRAARAASYEPGVWLAVSGERVWVLAALDPSTPLATAVHAAVAADAAPSAVLALLVGDGPRLAGFAVAGADGDETQLIVAGAAVAEVDTAHGERSRVAGLDASTWAEERVSGATRIRLAGGERLGGAVVALPLAAGMAYASALTLTPARPTAAVTPPAEPPTPVPAPEPMPAAAPEPEPAAEVLPEVADLNAGPRASTTAPAPPDSVVPSTPAPPSPSVETMQPPAGDGLIDSVPWSIPGGPPGPGPVDAPAEAVQPAAPARPQPVPSQPLPPPQLTARAPAAGAAGAAAGAAESAAGTAPGNPLGWVPATPVAASDTMYPPPLEAPAVEAPPAPAAEPSAAEPPAVEAPAAVAPPTYAVAPPPLDLPREPPAAVAPAPAPAPAPPGPPTLPLATPAPQPAAAPGGRLPDGPEQTVLAVVCPYGHLSPPYVGACRVCNTPIAAQEPFQTPRPVLGILNLSTGDMVTLDRDVILGRAPAVPPGEPNRRPHVVRLSSPGNDISRTHVEVRLDGWHVLVTDLGSTNGTVATLPGQPPVRLRAHDALAVVPGTIVSIADEVSFRFEVPA